ncbi:MAG: M3 family metallopeptidase [Bacteroidales bacterium]|nr:M3 family metallopeptidase [Bacteroidales bacterium]
MNTNPLLLPFNTPYGTFPFDKIRVEHIKPALLQAMDEEKAEIETICANTETPTFANTIVALEHSGHRLEVVTTYMYNMLSANTCDELDAVAEEMQPVLSQHHSDIVANTALYQRIAYVHDHADAEALNAEDKMLLDTTYRSFIRAGAHLCDEKKEKLREIRAELSKQTLAFSRHLLNETNAFLLHITDEADLAGLPELQRVQAQAKAGEMGKTGWVFTLHAPSFVPFMTYAEKRSLRHDLYMAYHTRCLHDNADNNESVVKSIVNLRREMARILGYDTYADYALERRMANNTARVYDLLNQLVEAYHQPALEEVEQVEAFARQSEGEEFQLEPWDFAYYANRLKKQRYDIDANMLRPYLPLNAVIDGVFGLATRLYGITFLPAPEVTVYHPDVKAYEVHDADGTFLAILYTDFHPRAGKQGGAWMTNFREESDYTERPHVSLTMNFTPPTADSPALLTLQEVETFLHEFGHALHSIFAQTRYASLSGTNVYWDFVELPSQFMENYATERDFLRTFARHYQTGEVIPDTLIERVRQSRTFHAAWACMRQVSFGLIDMAYYTLATPFDADIRAFERAASEPARVMRVADEACMTVQFSHIMAGGYAAGYYSYKWAEVLDADAFSLFKERGIFDKATASRFRHTILEKGGTVPPMALFEAFRGRGPRIDALLERDGIDARTAGCH